MQVQNRYLDYSIDSSYQKVDKPFALQFESKADKRGYTWYYISTVETKDYNVMIDRRNFFNQPDTNNIRTYENIIKVTTGQGDDYTKCCFESYQYFKVKNIMTAIDLK